MQELKAMCEKLDKKYEHLNERLNVEIQDWSENHEQLSGKYKNL